MIVLLGLHAALAQDPLREVFKHPMSASEAPSDGRRSRNPAWDVERYSVDIRLDPGARVLTGRITIVAAPLTAAPGPIVLDADGPVVSAVTVGDAPAVWTAADGEITVEVPAEPVRIVVDYTAAGSDGGSFTGLFWGQPIWTQNEPTGARTWLVVVDDPAEKAVVDWAITAPSEREVVANGLFVGVTDRGDGFKTWEYELAEPIPPYLMAFMAGDYEVVAVDGAIPVESWGYPDRGEALALGVGDTSAMLGFYGRIWGDYTWPLYRNVMTPLGGGMEHPTATSFGEDLVDKPHGEFVNAHEIAHHWWGNDVTCASWDEIWLNEGFATYGEVLWVESSRGSLAAADYRAALREAYLGWIPFEAGSTLYAPNFLWGGTVYDKGGMVVHMLREQVGDDAFFAGLALYRERHHLDVATSEDLLDAMESASDQDLDWFFDQWVYRPGDPQIVVGVTSTELRDGGYQVDVHVQQEGDAWWRFPARWDIALEGGEIIDARRNVEGPLAVFSYCTDEPAADLVFDPEEDLLYASLTRDDARFVGVESVCGTSEWVGGARTCSTTPASVGAGWWLVLYGLRRRSRVAAASAARASAG